MKVIHYARFSPNACGLYHTTKDLVKAEKGVGIDAHFVDIDSVKGVATLQEPGKKDGWMTTSDPSVAEDADILVRHTSMPNDMENSGIPVVLAIHGRPQSSLLLDERTNEPIVEGMYNKGRDCRYKAFFTFWPEHVSFWKRIVPEHKLHLVPAMVDLMEWRPGGKKFDFGEHNGKPNILIADIWRADVTPFEEIMAVAEWIKTECPSARLHIAAAPTGKGANVLWRALREEKVLGYACGQTKDIKEIYEACDVVVTPHTIATRIVREGSAMGKDVIHANALTTWWDTFRLRAPLVFRAARKRAETNFCLSNAGQAAKTMYESILNQKPTRRKVLLDIGGHTGETVRRFYREVEDARFYEIHTFEPHPECFKKLTEVLKRMKNVTYHQEAVVGGAPDALFNKQLFPGRVNDGEGSTMIGGKTTGAVDYANPIQINAVSLLDAVQKFFPDAEIVLKMNIEGGEYDLMRFILEKNIVGYFKQIYVQVHKHKLAEASQAGLAEIENGFRKVAQEKGVELFMTEKGMARFQCSQD